MKWIKKCPTLLLIVSTGLLLTIVGIAGKNKAYAQSEYHITKMPVLSLVFMGINDNVYPWQIFSVDNSLKAVSGDADQDTLSENQDTLLADVQQGADGNDGSVTNDVTEKTGTNGIDGTTTINSANDGTNLAQQTASPSPSPTPTATPEPDQGIIMADGTIEPYRESTYDEYISHISADIYGTTGEKRAAEYAFTTVDESYFDDALFVGDSRMVGLRDYTTLSEHGDFYCETSLTIYDVFDKTIGGKGTVDGALSGKNYGKIYLEVGINELGRGTTEDFIGQYKDVVDKLREKAPDAVIFLQAIMKVSAKKDASDAIFNNSNITARNHAIASLADNEHIFYVDMNPVVCDEDGNLIADYTFDQIHVLGKYNDLWKEVLLEHGVQK